MKKRLEDQKKQGKKPPSKDNVRIALLITITGWLGFLLFSQYPPVLPIRTGLYSPAGHNRCTFSVEVQSRLMNLRSGETAVADMNELLSAIRKVSGMFDEDLLSR